MGSLLLLVVALGAIAWLLFRIGAQLQAIGDRSQDAGRLEGRRRVTQGRRWPVRVSGRASVAISATGR